MSKSNSTSKARGGGVPDGKVDFWWVFGVAPYIWSARVRLLHRLLQVVAVAAYHGIRNLCQGACIADINL